MSWPHKDDGTVDWEAVFEDDDIGLLAYIKSARTDKALGQCAHVIIQSLFIRDQDPPYRDAYNAAVDELVGSGDGHARDKLLHLIREIKINRIERAGHYLNRDEQGDERRHHADDPAQPLETLKDG